MPISRRPADLLSPAAVLRAALASLAILSLGGAGEAEADFAIESTLPESVYQAVRSNPMSGDRAIQRFSADGTRLIGAFDLGSDDEAFVWSASEGIILLGDFAGGRYDATPTGISADGGIIVGRSWGSTTDDPFIWDDVNGMQPLAPLPTGYNRATPLSLSADGGAVAGYLLKNIGPPEAFYWSAATGVLPLGLLPGGSQSWGTAVSADGSSVAGYGLISGGREAFRWTAAGGVEALGDLPGSHHWSQGLLISENGEALAGYGWVQDNCDGQCSYPAQRAFRWTAAEGMVDLDSFTTFLPYSVPVSASPDGSVIVGLASDGRHFLWRAGLGNEQLEPLFATESGTDAADWEIAPLQIVDDGDSVAILGVGRYLSDAPVVWRLRLDPPPVCSDGQDNDGDGQSDYPDDPGCRDATAEVEDPDCDDDIDNDADGTIDWDGGSGGATADDFCANAWQNREAPGGCGLGPGLALLIVPLLARRGRRAGGVGRES